GRTYVTPDGMSAEVHLYSDGRFPDVANFAAGNLAIEYHRIGNPGPEAVDNVGIVAFNAVRDEQNPSRLQVLVRVLNFRPTPADGTVELEWRIAGQADFNIDSKEVKLRGRVYQPGDAAKDVQPQDEPGEQVVTFQLNDVEDSADVVLHARLKGWKDQFA